MYNPTQKQTKAPESNSSTEQEQVQRALQGLTKGIDLEASARYYGALVRRRVIHQAVDLLRMVMVYSLMDVSLRMTGLWGTVMGWGSLCKSGVRKRLRQCSGWVGGLIVSVLVMGQVALPRANACRFRLIDVTTVSGPGSHKIDWRMHLDFTPTPMGIHGVQLTDGRVGESLTRWQFAPNDVVLADRVYGVSRSLGVLFASLSSFVIRIGWQNLPLTDQAGSAFSIPAWLRILSTDPAAAPAQAHCWVTTPQGRFPLRLIARAIPPDKAARIRQRLRAEAKHKKRAIDERSLLAAGFVMVVSNLPDTWTAADILALYRFRWQIELVFKRLKGLLCFDHLRASDPQLAQLYLLTKILIALVLGQAQWRLALLAPDTYTDPRRPVSQWRLTQLVLAAFRQAVCGCLTWEMVIQHLPSLARYLCDDPRRRQSQLVALFHLEMRCAF
jgi:hypothetical protein